MNDKVVGISEYTEKVVMLRNVSKAELLKRFKDELSEFKNTQVFYNVKISFHASVAGKPDYDSWSKWVEYVQDSTNK
jgi:hypothetical protein